MSANDDGITEIMKAHVRFADKLGLKATPSYLIARMSRIQGHPGQKTLKRHRRVGPQMRQGGVLDLFRYPAPLVWSAGTRLDLGMTT